MSKYRIVEDYGNIGIEPITIEHMPISHGTYHGRLWVVQGTSGQIDDGWNFLAAFRTRDNAEAYVRVRA